MLTVSYTAASTIEDFDDAAQLAFRVNLRANLLPDVPLGNIQLDIQEGSIIITARIRAPASPSARQSILDDLRTANSQSMADLSSSLGLTITSASEPIVVTQPVIAPSPPPPSPPPTPPPPTSPPPYQRITIEANALTTSDGDDAEAIGWAVFFVVFATLVCAVGACCLVCSMRRRSHKVAPAPPEGVLTTKEASYITASEDFEPDEAIEADAAAAIWRVPDPPHATLNNVDSLPSFVVEATTIQKHERARAARAVLWRLMMQREARQTAKLWLDRATHGAVQRAVLHAAVTKLQARVRMLLAVREREQRSEQRRRDEAARTLQSALRRRKDRRALNMLLCQVRTRIQHRRRHEAVLTLQSAERRRQAQRELAVRKHHKRVREILERQHEAVTTIQTAERLRVAWRMRQQLAREKESSQREVAAITIQAYARSMLALTRCWRLKMQREVRRTVKHWLSRATHEAVQRALTHERALAQLELAATTIQVYARSKLALVRCARQAERRTLLREMKARFLTIMSRRLLAAMRRHVILVRTHRAAIVVQRAARRRRANCAAKVLQRAARRRRFWNDEWQLRLQDPGLRAEWERWHRDPPPLPVLSSGGARSKLHKSVSAGKLLHSIHSQNLVDTTMSPYAEPYPEPPPRPEVSLSKRRTSQLRKAPRGLRQAPMLREESDATQEIGAGWHRRAVASTSRSSPPSERRKPSRASDGQMHAEGGACRSCAPPELRMASSAPKLLLPPPALQPEEMPHRPAPPKPPSRDPTLQGRRMPLWRMGSPTITGGSPPTAIAPAKQIAPRRNPRRLQIDVDPELKPVQEATWEAAAAAATAAEELVHGLEERMNG